MDKIFFYVHWSVHRNNILVYKSQQDAHVTEFILSDNCFACFGRHHHPSSGAQDNCNYSISYSVTVTRCCSYSRFVLLKMGDNDALNIEQLSDKINSETCASCWDLYTKIWIQVLSQLLQILFTYVTFFVIPKLLYVYHHC
jgi:hypothetical protein